MVQELTYFISNSMKKLIITIVITASISLGFTLIEKKTETKATPVESFKTGDFKKSEVVDKQDDKRIASWD